MRLAFMGSPAFALPALRALHAAHEVVAVYCQPARPAGRGQQVTPCPVHAEAMQLGLQVRTPARLRGDAGALADFVALDLDVCVVAAYGLILPQAFLDAPARGCLNIHASLLPRWRGAGPIQAAVLAGDHESGITIMQMEAGLDTGPMLLRGAVPIGATTTAATLHDVLADLGGRLILDVVEGDFAPEPQPADGITYAPKLTRADGRLDWSRPAVELDRQVRGLVPWPGAFTELGAETLKVLEARLEEGAGVAGLAIDDRLSIACGTGALRLLRVQRPGRGPMAADAMLRGLAVPSGTRVG